MPIEKVEVVVGAKEIVLLFNGVCPAHITMGKKR